MMMVNGFQLLLVLIPLFGSFSQSQCFIEDGYKRYNDYSVLRFIPTNVEQLKFLYDLAHNETFLMERGVDFWTAPGNLNASVDVMLSPEARSSLAPLFKSNLLNPSVMIDDVQR